MLLKLQFTEKEKATLSIVTGIFSNAPWFVISITWTKQNFLYIIYIFSATEAKPSIVLIEETVCAKKDWGSRTGESEIKFKRTMELKIVNEQVFVEIVMRNNEKWWFGLENVEFKIVNCKLIILKT